MVNSVTDSSTADCQTDRGITALLTRGKLSDRQGDIGRLVVQYNIPNHVCSKLMRRATSSLLGLGWLFCLYVCSFTGRSVHCLLYTVPVSHIALSDLSPAARENQYEVSFLLTASNFWDAKSLVSEVTSSRRVLSGKLTVAYVVSLLAFNGTGIFLVCHFCSMGPG